MEGLWIVQDPLEYLVNAVGLVDSNKSFHPFIRHQKSMLRGILHRTKFFDLSIVSLVRQRPHEGKKGGHRSCIYLTQPLCIVN
jgi:hypothetical protein